MNPEIERTLKLELTQQKLGLNTFIVFSFYLLAFVLVPDVYENGDRDLNTAVKMCAGILLLLSTVRYLSLVGASITNELLGNTWDWSRLSSLSPGKILLAKLLAGPIELCFLVFNLTVYLAIPSYESFAAEVLASNISLVWKLKYFVSVILAVATVALALINSNFHLIYQFAKSNKRNYPAQGGIAGMVVGLIFLGPLALGLSAALEDLSTVDQFVNFYTLKIELLSFIIFSLGYAVALFAFSTYRAIERELQYPQIPWGFPVALLVFIMYCNGFLYERPILEYLWLDSAILLFATWALVLNYAGETVDKLKKVKLKFLQKKYRQAFISLPLWMPTLGVTTLLVLVGIASVALVDPRVLVIFWLLVFVLRDCALFIWLSAAPAAGGVGAGARIFTGLFVLYALLPLLALGLDPEWVKSFYPTSYLVPYFVEGSKTTVLEWGSLLPNTGLLVIFSYLAVKAIHSKSSILKS